MKDHLLQTVLAQPVEQRSNLAREYLQLYLLRLNSHCLRSNRRNSWGSGGNRLLKPDQKVKSHSYAACSLRQAHTIEFMSGSRPKRVLEGRR